MELSKEQAWSVPRSGVQQGWHAGQPSAEKVAASGVTLAKPCHDDVFVGIC